jgi:hypothetical protein
MGFEKLIADIEEVSADFIKYFGNLSEQQLNYRKQQDQWSIAQCIEHIILMNESYFSIVTAIRENKYKAGWNTRIGLLPIYFGKRTLNTVHPDNKKKFKTITSWQPLNTKPIDEIGMKFIAHQQRLKHIIISSQDLVQTKATIHSPVNKIMVYTLSDAFKIMVAHEQRHLQQAKALLVMQYSEKMII